MPLLSSPVPNLINGVSQQPAATRQASQLELQENCYSSIVEGLSKRSPTKHIAKLGSADISDAFIHLINRGSLERYQVVVVDGDLFVYDLVAGTQKTVNFPAGKDYLQGTTPKTDIRCVTVADYTFVVNNTKPVVMGSTLSASNAGKALVSVKQGQYSTTYTIKIDGQVATSFISDATNIAEIQTDFIAQKLIERLGVNSSTAVTTAQFLIVDPGPVTTTTNVLKQIGAFSSYVWHAGDTITITDGTGVVPGTYAILSKLNDNEISLGGDLSGSGSNLLTGDIVSASSDFSTDYTFVRSGSSIYITKNNGTSIDIAVEDSYGNRAITVAATTVQQFSDLPTVAPAGFTTKVLGDAASDADDYYVTFVPLQSSQTFSNGTWVESVGPGVHTQLDTTTMPHVLIRESDGTFTFQEGDWEGREVGDETSNKDPSFVGNTIQDIFFFRNRLGVVTKNKVVCGVEDEPFKFFRETVTTLLDTDPIDLNADQNHPVILKHAVPFHEELLLFSESGQYILSSDTLLTPKTAVVNQATDYVCSLEAKPVGTGDNIYFAFPRGDFSGLHEYFVQDGQAANKEASDVTAHVPKYISGTITRLASCTSEHLVVALSEGLDNGLYLYKYYWDGDQKVQSSWSKYLFESGSKVLSADFINSTLYLIVQRDDGYHSEKMDFQDGQVDDGSAFTMLLDRRITEEDAPCSYNPGTQETTWALPYEVTGTMRVVVRAGDSTYLEGRVIALTGTNGTFITAKGDFTSTKVYIGQAYISRWKPTRPTLREQAPSGGSVANSAGHLLVKTYTFVHDATAFFEVKITPSGRSTYTKRFNTLTLGVDSPGEVRLLSGNFRAAVMSRSVYADIEVTSDSHLPFHFVGASWEGQFDQRSGRA